MTFTNEILDLPHHVLGDQATTWNQRTGEISIELIIFISVIAMDVYIFRTLIRRIKILEGFLPICAGCKKIRNQDQWVQIESYISAHSPVQFTHSMCPECLRKYYPELFSHKP